MKKSGMTTFLIDHHHALMYLEAFFKMYCQQITVSFHIECIASKLVRYRVLVVSTSSSQIVLDERGVFSSVGSTAA